MVSCTSSRAVLPRATNVVAHCLHCFHVCYLLSAALHTICSFENSVYILFQPTSSFYFGYLFGVSALIGRVAYIGRMAARFCSVISIWPRFAFCLLSAFLFLHANAICVATIWWKLLAIPVCGFNVLIVLASPGDVSSGSAVGFAYVCVCYLSLAQVCNDGIVAGICIIVCNNLSNEMLRSRFPKQHLESLVIVAKTFDEDAYDSSLSLASYISPVVYSRRSWKLRGLTVLQSSLF